MGRVKYRGHDSKNNNNNKSKNKNNNNNHDNNNNNNHKNKNQNNASKQNGSIATNGKHRNGSGKRRARIPSAKDKNQLSSGITSIILTTTIVILSAIIAFRNVDVFSQWYSPRSDTNKSTTTTTTTTTTAAGTPPQAKRSAQVRLSSGGWRLASEDVLRKYDPGLCSIEKISVLDLPPEKFESEVRFKKPVLVTFPAGASDWTDPLKWSRDSLVKEYSRWTISSGESLEIVRKGGNGNHKSTFMTFIDRLLDNVYNGNETTVGEPMNYAFDRQFYWQTKLPKTLKLPEYFEVDRSVDDSIFFLGSSLTGVVFHKHSDTWNGVVYGRKRWFLYPSRQTPPGGVHHGFTLLEWVNNVYPNLTESEKPMECVQEAGEILYLPEGTYHATLNLGDTVAVAIQKKDAHLNTEILFYEGTYLINSLQETPPNHPKDKRQLRMLEIFKELHTLLPENAEVMMKAGELLFDMEEYAESVKWHQMALEKEPYFILAYIQLGRTYAKLNRHDEAEQQFLHAMARSPNFWDIYKEYGEFLYTRGRVADALKIYKRGTELKPDLLPFWYFYKVCQEKVGDKEGAKATEKIMDVIKAGLDLDR